jgi:hypothetical protein
LDFVIEEPDPPRKIDAPRASSLGVSPHQKKYELLKHGLVNQSERYVLDGNLNSDPFEFGILILADDVHLDCQGNKIRGCGVLSQGGIGVTGAEDVTSFNCDVSGLFSATMLLEVGRIYQYGILPSATTLLQE